MNFIIWLVIGGLIGWPISPLVGIPTIKQDVFSLSALRVSMLGAITLFAVVNRVRRKTLR